MRLMRHGFSLLELAVALCLMGVSLSILLPAARRQVERAAVLSAREAAVAQVARARREARISGGATLKLRRDGSRIWVESSEASAGPPRDTLKLEDRFGVRLELTSAEAALSFDALGVGRIANRSLTFVRGGERTELIISAYGRVRRR